MAINTDNFSLNITTYIKDICWDVRLAVVTVRLARADTYVIVGWRWARGRCEIF